MNKCNKVHIAIVDIPTIKKIVQKDKTIESRFSKNRIKPFGIVEENDMILLKASGGDIYGYFLVGKVESLMDFDITNIENKYNASIIADKSFWEAKKNAKYGTLLYCKNPVMANSGISFSRKGMDGWIVVPQNESRQVICFAGQICSGKTTYAKKLAEILNAHYIHFGTVIRNYAKEQGENSDRKTLQNIGQNIMDTFSYANFMNIVMDQFKVDDDSRPIVFDGVRHIGVLSEICNRYDNVKLIYVNAAKRDRYNRYLIKEGQSITIDDFNLINAMPVESEITQLKETADIIINSRKEENINESSIISSNIIASLLTGYIHNK